MTITRRDYGRFLLEQQPAQRCGEQRAALAVLEEALIEAEGLGCPSLQLKCHLELRRAAPGYYVDRDVITKLVDSTECEAIRRQRDSLVEVFSQPSGPYERIA